LDNLKLTIDEIRNIHNCQNLSEKQAEQLSDLLSIYAITIFRLTQLKKFDDETTRIK